MRISTLEQADPRMLSDLSAASESALLQQAKAIVFILEAELETLVSLHDAVTGERVALDENEAPWAGETIDPDELADAASSREPSVSVCNEQFYRMVLPLAEFGTPRLLAVAHLPRFARSPAEVPHEIRRLEKWLRLLAEKLTRSSQQQRPSRNELTEREQQAWSIVAGLDAVLSTSRLHGEPARFQKKLLKVAAEVLGAETVVWVPLDRGADVSVHSSRACSENDCRDLARELLHSCGWDSTDVLIQNASQGRPLTNKMENVSGILALKVTDEQVSGCLIALNKSARAKKRLGSKPSDDVRQNTNAVIPFQRSDAALLSSIVAPLTAQFRTAVRITELKEFVVGLTRSLTAAIDAKDPYTYGHSERVARISVEIARELGSTDDEINDVYLAGLLHDIGKIGIKDAVLGKTSELTPAEREHVNSHPQLGYQILSGLSAIKHLLGGVLYHHERVDGRGYPEGLRGEQIPRMAKIIAVADCFDAMYTDRPYRAGMTVDRIETIFTEGAGKHWDATIVEAFRRCKSRIQMIKQRGIGESLCCAIDGAMRQSGTGISELVNSLPAAPTPESTPQIGMELNGR